jgi:hypothetical protein
VRISSCTTTTIGLEIKKLKKLKSIILKVMIYTAPSPVQCAHEGIHSPKLGEIKGRKVQLGNY